MIKWEQIETECGDYRSGFVATFRKYEGQPTDETDDRGRIVKVTVASFARHAGIPRITFHDWVRRSKVSIDNTIERQQRQSLVRARSMVRQDPTAVVEGIMDAPESVQDRIFDELKMRRAGVDTSPANRKAADAAVDESYGQPIRRALQVMQLPMVVDALREARETLAQIRAKGGLTPEMLEPIAAEHEAFALELAEARFALSDGEVSR